MKKTIVSEVSISPYTRSGSNAAQTHVHERVTANARTFPRMSIGQKQGRLPKSRVNGVLRVMKKMRVMKKDASDEKRCE